MSDACIETRRLVLEPLVAAHADVLFEGLRDDRVYAFVPDDRRANAEALRDRYRMLERRSSPDGSQLWLNWAVRRRDPPAYIGYVQATIDAPGHATIGYVIFPELWGSRFASEAVTALVEHLRSQHAIAEIDAYIDGRNAASLALVRRLGFRPHGGERWSHSYQ